MAKKKQLDKLSLDMIECEKAGFGCHYGAWKATQEPVKPVPLPTDKYEFKCINCGQTFFQKSRRPRKYCNEDCGKEYRYKRECGLLTEGAAE